MPHGRGHRRVHSYFSGFTVSGAVVTNQPIHKAVSSSSLYLKLPTSSHLPKTKSAQDLSATDCLEVQPLRKQREHSFVTVPSFVRHSVKQLDPSQMARPRSPKSKSGGECSHQQMEDMLDHTLLAIRQQLVSLSS